ncbi:nucleolar complex protein 4 homolog isoform X2 [Dendrobium catenatum]|uniref:nucleolar complex protein 4 homolog isoform X2 n=1 Tax=Dendrobium catenatum TaxID=906689 RepID=UPI00109EE3A7|nr:nucleolar complex protein 4 homolog isoform X2 [Dendrobium catenatum]
MASFQENRQKHHHTKKKKDKKGETLTVEDLKFLGLQLLSSRAHINNLPILLSVLSPTSSANLVLESLISLQSFFLPLLPEVPSASSLSKKTGAEEDPDAFYSSWLRARFDELVNSLIEIAVSYTSVEAIKDVALDAIMDFVKQEKEGRFNSSIYYRLLKSIVSSAPSTHPLLNQLAAKYFKYIDICYFTYTSLDKISKDCNSTTIYDDRKDNLQNPGEETESRFEVSIRTIYKILSCVPPLETLDEQQSHEMWSQLRLSPKDENNKSSNVIDVEVGLLGSKMLSKDRIMKKFKLRFTKAWLSFLKLSLPLDVYKEVLATLHQNVIPYMSNPAILCDFLIRSYDIGGVISVMALSGLFILMTQHGLEYPKFYEKLYVLLKPDVFMAKHRAGFFQLLDTCLKSSYLPAYLAAAFIKKLSRLALSVPPSGELIIIALIHNLLRRHPSINFLVQQQVDDLVNGDASAEGDDFEEYVMKSNADPAVQSMKHCIDPFNNEEANPLKSNAMRSSLWEIDTLRHHYCPAVSRFVASLENDLTVRAKTSEMAISDFSSGSYATIFREEVRRRIKQCPVAFYRETPTCLFNESDFPGWSFGDHQQVGVEENGNGVDRVVGKITLESEDRDVKRLRIESY